MEQTRAHLEMRKDIAIKVADIAELALQKQGVMPTRIHGARLALLPEAGETPDDPHAPTVIDGLMMIRHDDGTITLWKDDGGIGPRFIAYIQPDD